MMKKTLLLLALAMMIENIVLPSLQVSGLTCNVDLFFQGKVKLEMTQCLKARIVTPSTFLDLTVTLTNLGSSRIVLLNFADFPFEVDIYNSTGQPVGNLGPAIYSPSPDRYLETGASVSEQFLWQNTPTTFLRFDNSSGGNLGEFFAQAFLDSETLLNNTVVIDSHQIGGSVLSYQVVSQLILSYDVFETLMVTLLGATFITLILLLREIQRIRKQLSHTSEAHVAPKTQPDK